MSEQPMGASMVYMRNVETRASRPRDVVHGDTYLESTLTDLRDSGLVAGLQTGLEGMSVWLGENPRVSETCGSPSEAATWLTKTAIERYPESNFAKKRK